MCFREDVRNKEGGLQFNMLNKNLRLDRGELDIFFSTQNKTFVGKIITVRFVKNNQKTNRFAFIVSFVNGQAKKGRSVLRNLARRRMSEVIRNLINKIQVGYDIVFFYKIKDRKISKIVDLKKDIEYVLHKCNLSRNIL